MRFTADKTVDKSEPKQGYRLTPGRRPPTCAPLGGFYDTRANLYAVNGHESEVTTEGQSLLLEYAIDPTLSVKSITAHRKSLSYAPIDFDSLNTADLGSAVDLQRQADQPGIPADLHRRAPAGRGRRVLHEDQRLQRIRRAVQRSRRPVAADPRRYRHQDLGRVRRRQLQPDRHLQHHPRRPLYQRPARGRHLQAHLPRPGRLADPGQSGRHPAAAPNTDLGPNDLHRTDKKFTPKIGFGWKLAPEHNVYSTFAKGFKGGMFDPRMDLVATGGPNSAASLVKRQGVEPEEVSTIELGLKSALNGGRIQTNAAVFYTDYKNVQVPGSIPTFNAAGAVTRLRRQPDECRQGQDQGPGTGSDRLRDQPVERQRDVQLHRRQLQGMVRRERGRPGQHRAIHRVPEHAAQRRQYRRELRLAVRRSWAATVRSAWPTACRTRARCTRPRSSARQASLRSIRPWPGNLALAQSGYTLWDAGLVWTSADRKIQFGLHGRNLADKRYKVGRL